VSVALQPDIAVIGASLGGVLAAWRAAQAGRRVLLVAEHAWLGGQMTAQAVPPDEHALVELGGASRSYLAFREDIRAHYREQPGFLDASTVTPGLTNPGDGWVSRLCFEPVIAARWFERLLAAQRAAGRLQVLRLAWPVAATRAGPRITSVMLRGHDGRIQQVQATLFIDATDTGELLRLAHLPYRLGKEAAAAFNEPDAPPVADPLDQQPCTHVLALRRHPQPGPMAAAPASYAAWRAHRLPHFQHLLFSPQLPGRGRGESAMLPFEAGGSTLDWWRYRRVVSSGQWADGRDDVSLVNWAQNDYASHPLLDGPIPQADVQAAARELSLCLLHWLHTEAPRGLDNLHGGHGFPEWQPAADLLGTCDGLAQQTYVRESRRIVAHTTLTQRDLLTAPTDRDDAVGIGAYNLDIHPTCVSGHGVNASVMPFVLPLGAFIPLHADNLLPACKNLGVTHLASACTRVHPVEWLAGEVAGLMAAHLVEQGLSARALPDDAAHCQALQHRLHAAGIPTAWTEELLARAAAAAH
jgi:hypothetical protein